MDSGGSQVLPRLSLTSSIPEANLSTRYSAGISDTLHSSKSILPRKGSGIPPKQQAKQEAYLSELLSYSLERLRKEPEILTDEKQQLERSLQATAVAQYPAFIETADCLDTISKELGSVCEHLDRLLQGIPQLATSCEAFGARASHVLDAYAHNKQLASHQSELQELLEVPQLMDTCVRNGVYDEALDLQAFVSRMALLHPHLPLVKMLMQQASDVSQSMLQQLLGRLKTGIQLPECLRVMGYLRRMGAFSEAQLRLHFLQCRDEWLTGLIEELDDSDAYEYIKHLTDIHRLHLFDAIMQYRAIFFDSTATQSLGPLTGNTSSVARLTTTNSFSATQPAIQEPAALSASVRETCLLHSWVQQRLAVYLTALATYLPAVTQGGNLASALEHCMYCGSSLSRVGLDFQGLLLPLFQRCALALFSQHLAAAVDSFNASHQDTVEVVTLLAICQLQPVDQLVVKVRHKRLETHKWVAMHTPMLKRQADKEAASTKTSQDGTGGEQGGATKAAHDVEAEDMSPPYSIMEHVPLAMFVNGVLTALNELRQCALQSCAQQAAGLLQQAVEHVAASLMHYRSTRVLSDADAALFSTTTRTALDVVLPYLSTCYARVFQGTGHKLDCSSAATILRSILQQA